MTRYMWCIAVLSVAAYAQAPLVEPCGGVASCVRVGVPDGGQVQLGGVVQTSRYQLTDGGSTVRIQPLSPVGRIDVLGNNPRGSIDPDVVIGGLQARDGGQGPIVSFRTGGWEVATVTAFGITNNGSDVAAVGKFAALDAGTGDFQGNVGIAGTLKVIGASTLGTIDGGAAYFRADVQVGGNILATGNKGTCTLDAASPSKCTILNMPAGSTCVCGGKGTSAAAAVGVAASLTSTTLTCTAANGLSSDVNAVCF